MFLMGTAEGSMSCEDLRALLTVLSHKYRNQTAVLTTLLKMLQLYDPLDGPTHYLKWVEILSVLLEGLESQLLCCLVSSLPLPIGADQMVVRQKAQDIIGSPLLLPYRPEKPQERSKHYDEEIVAEICTSNYDLFIAEGASLDHDGHEESAIDEEEATSMELLIPGKKLANPVSRQSFRATVDYGKICMDSRDPSGAEFAGIDKMAGGEPFDISAMPMLINEQKFAITEQHFSFVDKEMPSKDPDSSESYSPDTSLSIDIADSNSEYPTATSKLSLVNTERERCDDALVHESCLTRKVHLENSLPPALISSENSSFASLDCKHDFRTLDLPKKDQLILTSSQHTDTKNLKDELSRSDYEVNFKGPEQLLNQNVQGDACVLQKETTGIIFENKEQSPELPIDYSKIKPLPPEYPLTCSKLSWTPTNVHNVFGFPTKNGKLVDLSSDDSDVENEPKHDPVITQPSTTVNSTAKLFPAVTVGIENNRKPVFGPEPMKSSAEKSILKNFICGYVSEPSYPSSPIVHSIQGNPAESVQSQKSECEPSKSDVKLPGMIIQQQDDQCLLSPSASEVGRAESSSNILYEKENVNILPSVSKAHILNEELQSTLETQDTTEVKNFSMSVPDSVRYEQQKLAEKPNPSKQIHSPVTLSRPFHMYPSNMLNTSRTEWIPSTRPVIVPLRRDSPGSVLQVHKSGYVSSESEPEHISGQSMGSLKKGQKCSGSYQVPYFVRTTRGSMLHPYTTLAQATFATQPTAVVRRPVPCVQQSGISAMQQLQERQVQMRTARRLQMVRVQPSGWGSMQQLRRAMTGPGGRSMVWPPGRQAVLVRRQHVSPQDSSQANLPAPVRRHNLEDIVQVLRSKTV